MCPAPHITPSVRVKPTAAVWVCVVLVAVVVDASSAPFVWTSHSFETCDGGAALHCGSPPTSVTCVSSYGRLPPSPFACSASTRPSDTLSCEASDWGDQCTAPSASARRWVALPWEPCATSVPCDADSSLQRSTTRTVLCVAGGGTGQTGITVVPDSQCLFVGSKPETTKPCATFLCPTAVHRWDVSDWTDCGAVCGTGQQTREAFCVDVAGTRLRFQACNDLPKPLLTRPCTSDTACPCQIDSDCLSDPGTSCLVSVSPSGEREGVCRPHWPVIAPAPCLMDVSDGVPRSCCPTGSTSIDANTGSCCAPGAVTDAAGSCCDAGWVDACGQCAGPGVAIDIRGVCCPHPLTPSGLCCEDGTMDDCGVCGGSNDCDAGVLLCVSDDTAWSSGESTLAATLLSAAGINLLSHNAVAVSSISLSSTLAATLTISASRVSSALSSVVTQCASGGAGPPSTLLALRLRPASDATSSASIRYSVVSTVAGVSSSMASPAVWRLPQCGDGRCQHGEACLDDACLTGCASDCLTRSLPCPTVDIDGQAVECGAHGVCLFGGCECFSGYTGSVCTQCAPRFFGVVDGLGRRSCSKDPTALFSCSDGVQNGFETGTDCGGTTCESCPSSQGLVVGLATAGAVLGAVLVGVGFLCFIRHGKSGRGKRTVAVVNGVRVRTPAVSAVVKVGSAKWGRMSSSKRIAREASASDVLRAGHSRPQSQATIESEVASQRHKPPGLHASSSRASMGTRGTSAASSVVPWTADNDWGSSQASLAGNGTGKSSMGGGGSVGGGGGGGGVGISCGGSPLRLGSGVQLPRSSSVGAMKRHLSFRRVGLSPRGGGGGGGGGASGNSGNLPGSPRGTASPKNKLLRPKGHGVRPASAINVRHTNGAAVTPRPPATPSGFGTPNTDW